MQKNIFIAVTFVLLALGLIYMVQSKDTQEDLPATFPTETSTTTSAATSSPESSTSTVPAFSAPTTSLSTSFPPSVTPPPKALPNDVSRNAGHAYGIAAGGGLTGLSTQKLNEYLDKVVTLGTTWLRIDIEWTNIEYAGPGQDNWSEYDRVIDAARARNLNVLGILAFPPPWARREECKGSPQCPPKDPSQFADFSRKAVARYKNKGVRHWEVWNEPNLKTYWRPSADSAAYTELLKKTYTTIKSEDKDAFVIVGGFSPQATGGGSISPLDFLEGIYAAGGKGYFDAIAHHPYTYPEWPSYDSGHAWAQMEKTNRNLRGIMSREGDAGKKIWLTEFGAPTGGPGKMGTTKDTHFNGSYDHVDENLQAHILKDAITLYRQYDWAGPIFYYSLQDSGTSEDNNENFFGLFRFDGTKKPAYFIFQETLSQI